MTLQAQLLRISRALSRHSGAYTWPMEPPDPQALAERIAEVQRLVRTYVSDRDSLVDALIAERREEAKFDYQRFMADESIPREERERFGTPLSDQEVACLKEGGIDLDKTIAREEDPLLAGYRDVADILLGAFTVDQVADRLDLSVPQVRELASNDELYVVDEKYGLERFPAFQFTVVGLLPGFQEIGPSIPKGMSMAGVETFFTTRNPDLYINDDIDQTLSPVEWLAGGYDPAAVDSLLKRF